MSDKPELKPCPFCGSLAFVSEFDTGFAAGCIAGDSDCPVRPKTREDFTEAEYAINAWQKRADLTKPSEWISVSDRLPEESGSYFVCLENDMVTEFNFSDIGARPYWFKVGFGSEVEENKVTHWQPLPSPPTRETP